MDVDHLTGKLAVAAQETTSITTQAGIKQTESTVFTPGRTGWELSTRTATTETTAPDGSVTRETSSKGARFIRQKRVTKSLEPLGPAAQSGRARGPRHDGTKYARDVFHRDVNGDWKAESFSTKEPNNGKI